MPFLRPRLPENAKSSRHNALLPDACGEQVRRDIFLLHPGQRVACPGCAINCVHGLQLKAQGYDWSEVVLQERVFLALRT